MGETFYGSSDCKLPLKFVVQVDEIFPWKNIKSPVENQSVQTETVSQQFWLYSQVGYSYNQPDAAVIFIEFLMLFRLWRRTRWFGFVTGTYCLRWTVCLYSMSVLSVGRSAFCGRSSTAAWQCVTATISTTTFQPCTTLYRQFTMITSSHTHSSLTIIVARLFLSDINKRYFSVGCSTCSRSFQ